MYLLLSNGVSPLLFNLSSQLILGGLYLSRISRYLKDLFIMFNYILHFCSSFLHSLQFSNVQFLVRTSYLCTVSQPQHNTRFI